MIITPHELQQWVSADRSFIAADIRPEEQRYHFPISGLEAITTSAEDLPFRKKEPLVLICQFGVLTEELIINQNLENTYSLLGGVQSWEAYQTDKNLYKDLRSKRISIYAAKMGKHTKGMRCSQRGISSRCFS